MSSLKRYIVLDVASAPIPDAAGYLESAKAPKNYKNAEAIAAYVAEETANRLAMAATDIDLARITAIGWQTDKMTEPIVVLCENEDHERKALTDVAFAIRNEMGFTVPVITYGGHNFDLPLLMRRARYLGVPFVRLSTDRFKSDNLDVLLELSDRNTSRYRPLTFYVRRLGLGLVKPLSGEEESKVHDSGKWSELEDSVRHDVKACLAVAEWAGLL